MLLAIVTLLTAISISFIAAWYSIAGLIAIFSAAVIPVIIMGGVLETGKIVATVWLHQNWFRAPRLFKWYLVPAVAILMFITSMGIFGFLSKAHIEQTSMSDEQVASIQTLEEKITRSEAKVNRWQTEIENLLKGGGSRVDGLAGQDTDALRELRDRMDKEKTNARADADKQITLQNERLKQAQDRKTADIEAAQKRYEKSFSKSGLDEAIEQAKKNELSVASASQREIKAINERLNQRLKEIDAKYAPEIKTINDRIGKLRSKASVKTDDTDKRVAELEKNIEAEVKAMDGVREEKFVYEKEFRKLEAEVGPIKYIAAFIYDDNVDATTLEHAIRWVILLLVIVFDPLALTLILASTKQFEWARNLKEHGTHEVVVKEVFVEPNLKTDKPKDVARMEQNIGEKLRKKNNG